MGKKSKQSTPKKMGAATRAQTAAQRAQPARAPPSPRSAENSNDAATAAAAQEKISAATDKIRATTDAHASPAANAAVPGAVDIDALVRHVTAAVLAAVDRGNVPSESQHSDLAFGGVAHGDTATSDDERDATSNCGATLANVVADDVQDRARRRAAAALNALVDEWSKTKRVQRVQGGGDAEKRVADIHAAFSAVCDALCGAQRCELAPVAANLVLRIPTLLFVATSNDAKTGRRVLRRLGIAEGALERTEMLAALDALSVAWLQGVLYTAPPLPRHTLSHARFADAVLDWLTIYEHTGAADDATTWRKLGAMLSQRCEECGVGGILGARKVLTPEDVERAATALRAASKDTSKYLCPLSAPTRARSRGPLAVFDTHANGVFVRALFDTGAAVSAVTADFAQQAQLAVRGETRGEVLRGADGSALELLGYIDELSVFVGDRVLLLEDVRVVRNLPVPLVLGASDIWGTAERVVTLKRVDDHVQLSVDGGHPVRCIPMRRTTLDEMREKASPLSAARRSRLHTNVDDERKRTRALPTQRTEYDTAATIVIGPRAVPRGSQTMFVDDIANGNVVELNVLVNDEPTVDNASSRVSAADAIATLVRVARDEGVPLPPFVSDADARAAADHADSALPTPVTHTSEAWRDARVKPTDGARREAIEQVLREYTDLFARTRGTDRQSAPVRSKSAPMFRVALHHHARLDKMAARPRPRASVERAVLRAEAQRLLDSGGAVRARASPFLSIAHAVRKTDEHGRKTDEWRVVADYVGINDNTFADAYPIPRIRDVLEHASRGERCSLLDAFAQYEQFTVDPASRPLTTTYYDSGYVLERVSAPYGLKGLPAFLQRWMESTVLVDVACARAYFDDIVVAHLVDTPTAIATDLRIVFAALRRNGVTLNARKCNIASRSTNILGHTVRKGSIAPDTERLQAWAAMSHPKTRSQLKSFLHTLSQYSEYWPSSAKLTGLLRNMASTGGSSLLTWDDKSIAEFEQYKAHVLRCTQPLTALDEADAVHLETDWCARRSDGSGGGVGWAIYAVRGGVASLVACGSRALRGAHVNYGQIRGELLALREACAKHGWLLRGRNVRWFTDCKSLEAIFSNGSENAVIRRMLLELQGEYSFNVQWRPGSAQAFADLLSRAGACDDALRASDALVAPLTRAAAQAAQHRTQRCRRGAQASATRVRITVPSNYALHQRNTAAERVAQARLPGDARRRDAQARARATRIGTVGRPRRAIAAPDVDHVDVHAHVQHRATDLILRDDPRDYSRVCLPGSVIGSARRELVLRQFTELPVLRAIGERLASPDAFFTHWRERNIVRDALLAVESDGALTAAAQCAGGNRCIVVPPSARPAILHAAHGDGHVHVGAMLAVLRRFVWWVSMVADAREYAQSCVPCQRGRDFPRRAVLGVPRSTFRPLHIVVIDLQTHIEESYILTVVDVATRYLWGETMAVKTSAATAAALERIFKHFAWPLLLVMDGGREFLGDVRAKLARYGVRVEVNAPYNPESRGVMERRHRTIAAAVAKLRSEFPAVGLSKLVERAVRAANECVFAESGVSAQEALFGAPLPSAIDRAFTLSLQEASNALAPLAVEHRGAASIDAVQEAVQKRHAATKKRLESQCPPKREFSVGDMVWLREVQATSKFEKRVSRTGPFVVSQVNSDGHTLQLSVDGRVAMPRAALRHVTPFSDPLKLSSVVAAGPPTTWWQVRGRQLPKWLFERQWFLRPRQYTGSNF